MSTQWPLARLGDVVSLDATTARPEELSDRDLYVGLENIASDGSLVGLGQVSAADLKSNKNRFNAGCVLFGKLRPYLAKVVRPETSGVCSTDILVLTPGSQIDRNYLYWWLRSPAVIEEATSKSTGATLPRISPFALASFQIPTPPLAEQKRIVGVLNRVEQNSSALESCVSRTLACVDDLLSAAIDTTIAKSGATTVLVGDVAEISYGYTESATAEQVGPKFLRITDIQDGRVDWDEVPYCSIDSQLLPKHQLKDGDIVFARTGATTGKSFLVKGPPKSVCASYLIRLRPDRKKMDPEFLSYVFRSAGYWRQIRSGMSGSAQGGFNATKLSNLLIVQPTLSEQMELVDVIREAESHIASIALRNSERLRKITEMRESILEAAFRGEL